MSLKYQKNQKNLMNHLYLRNLMYPMIHLFLMNHLNLMNLSYLKYLMIH